MKWSVGRALAAACLAGGALAAQGAAVYMPYADALPILRALRADLLPSELRDRTLAALEWAWPDWTARRDEAIRARVEEGDADSIIYLLQFGASFTRQPRLGERELAGLVLRRAGGDASEFVPSPILLARIDDFLAALAPAAGPGAPRGGAAANERLQFARQVIARRGIDPATEAGRRALRQHLLDRVEVIGQAERRSRLLNPDGDAVDQATLFRDRGLASDTAVWVNFGIEKALAELHAAGLLARESVHRVAIVGPGLDFTDKQEGYDFYPEQTIQPFALVDSLLRLGLAGGELQLTAFDLSPRVLQHLDGARSRARAGRAYTVVLPRNLDQPWTPDLVAYWERFGDRVGGRAPAPAPPSAAGRVDVRSVAIRAPVVLSVLPQDLNIVLQRVEPTSPDGPFDLIVATNLLIYYDVFEQSLAIVNVAAMLRPGGVFLSNDRIFQLPDNPLASIGHTSAIYMKAPAVGDTGDRIDWYQRR